MFHRRFLTAAVASAMTVAGLLASVPAAAKSYLQCVPFARAESGVEIRGNAKTWWAQAAGSYERGNEPRQGAVMAFAGTRGMPMGHVAVVKKIVSDREILIDHANWSPIGGRRGQIERGVRVVDVSDAGDWSLVRVWYAPIGDLGLRANPVQGFIYADGEPAGAASPKSNFKAPVWAQQDWKPGNGLETVVASLGH
ncbi:MAG: CHAP domain-containing protein [Sphingopyxis sp.]|uniref:CHAP domain-containing protein n=1 Tax=Sphingopyxis sp. TaxID=1908224 RepID=UPI0032EEF487